MKQLRDDNTMRSPLEFAQDAEEKAKKDYEKSILKINPR
jgi:hypothetical protein